MPDDKAAQLVVDMAQALVSTIQAIDSSWERAYLRFSREPGQSQVKASYVHAGEADLVSVMSHRDFFSFAQRTGEALLAAVGKERGVILVWVDSNFDYEVKFEYDDLSRWAITRMDGGTGIPVGLDA